MLCNIIQYNGKFGFDVGSNSLEPGASILNYFRHSDRVNQQFEIRDTLIFCVNSNLVLEARDGLIQGSYIIQNYPNGSINQKFYFKSDGTIRTENGLCIDTESGKCDKSPLILNKCSSKPSQQFHISNEYVLSIV